MAEERVQRRLAAILAADMVGYSRLIGADEEGTIARQKAHRAELIDPEITTHGGRIVKTMGDGLLVEFPSVVDAVKCAVIVQQAMSEREADATEGQRIQYRIGINLGDIVIDGDDILGDGVNVAARLEGIADPGGICISGDAHRQVSSKINYAFEDLGERTLKNIAEPVRAYRWHSGNAVVRTETAPDQEPRPSDQPSIAVLPFDNLSGDPEQEYFADGLAEDIITTLSKIPELLVIARNSTFTYKDQAVDIKQVGREQGVRYVLEGSVRKAGQRIRVTTQLIDAETGIHVWAERYDRALSDIFDLQDELTREVAIAMQVNLTKGEQAESWTRATESVAAWEQLMKGAELFLRHTKADNRQSLEHFKQAVKLDPDYAMAWVMLGWVHWNDARFSWSEAPKQSMALAWEYAEKAIALDDQNPDALILLATLKLFDHEHAEALDLAEKAVALNGNHSTNIAVLGVLLGYSERPQEAIETIQRAIRLSPIYPLWYHQNLARGYTQLEQYTDAIAQYEAAIIKSPEAPASYFNLAHVLFLSGKHDEARDAVAQGLRLNPRVTLANWRATLPYLNPQRTEDELNSLRQSGLPE